MAMRCTSLTAVLALVVTWLFSTPAIAAAPGGAGPSEAVLIAQLIVLLAVGRLLGELMHRIGQPAVMGQLLAGVLLGPSFLGWIWPEAEGALFPNTPAQKAMLTGIAQLGVLLLLLLTGMETDLKLARKTGRTSLMIALTGLSVPFVCGFTLGQFLPENLLPRPDLRLVTSLFLGTALSISSVKIVAMVIREMDFMRRNIGQVIVASAIIEDTIGWIIIALTLGIAIHGSLDLAAFAKSVFGTLLFLAASFTIGRKLVAQLIRWTNDNLVSELPVITVILIVMGAMALITDAIGVHTVLGAFVAGMLVGQSPILTRHIDEQLRGLITALFMPVFFAVAGLGADLTVLADPQLLLLTGGLLAIASFGKFGGAYLGGWLGGLSPREAFAVGSGMNARGSTEVIVATVGLTMGVLSNDLYTMIVAMAFLTTMAMPPMLRWALARLPMHEDERLRLEREAREEKGFVTSFERLLLTVDQSANARFAAHLAGLIAGSRQILTTVLQLDTPETGKPANAPDTQAVDMVIKSSAQSAQAVLPANEDVPETVTVMARQAADPAQSDLVTVEREARKGYDFLMIGLDPTATRNGMISPRVTEVAGAFDGPFAVADARGKHFEEAAPDRFSILLPIRATLHARRAAEFAIELARASHSPLEAVFVPEHEKRPWPRRLSASMASGLEKETALKEIVAQAEAQGVQIRTSIYRSGPAAAEIIRGAKRSRHDLIVLGVSQRPGDTLFFGGVAAEVLADSPCSVLLVSS